MSRRSSFLRPLLGVLLFVACLSMPDQRAFGQAYCTSCAQPDQVWRVDICMPGGQTRTVDVTVCNETYCPAQPLGEPCVPNPINARTVIKKICPVGWTGTTGDIQIILNKVIPKIGVCCGGNTYLSACPSNPDFVWLVNYPTCWEYTAANCWEPCLNAPCCTYLLHYQFNIPNPGDCSFNWGPVCGTGPEECHPPTVPLTCQSIGCNLNPEPCCP